MLLFVQRLLKQRCMLAEPERLSPTPRRPVRCNLIVLNLLRRSQKPRVTYRTFARFPNDIHPGSNQSRNDRVLLVIRITIHLSKNLFQALDLHTGLLLMRFKRLL